MASPMEARKARILELLDKPTREIGHILYQEGFRATFRDGTPYDGAHNLHPLIANYKRRYGGRGSDMKSAIEMYGG